MRTHWPWWGWVLFGFAVILVYSVGFVAATAYQAKTCWKDRHDECNHIWGDPVVPLWFVWVALGLALSPIWVPLVLCTKVSKRVDERIVENRERTELVGGE